MKINSFLLPTSGTIVQRVCVWTLIQLKRFSKRELKLPTHQCENTCMSMGK